jgi:hypothetical protein
MINILAAEAPEWHDDLTVFGECVKSFLIRATIDINLQMFWTVEVTIKALWSNWLLPQRMLDRGTTGSIMSWASVTWLLDETPMPNENFART